MRKDMEFKDKLIYARAFLNLTQTELAKEMGVSYTTINRWETGKVCPSKKAIIAFDIFCKQKNIKF